MIQLFLFLLRGIEFTIQYNYGFEQKDMHGGGWEGTYKKYNMHVTIMEIR